MKLIIGGRSFILATENAGERGRRTVLLRREKDGRSRRGARRGRFSHRKECLLEGRPSNCIGEGLKGKPAPGCKTTKPPAPSGARGDFDDVAENIRASANHDAAGVC
jgi:hypothetical protein